MGGNFDQEFWKKSWKTFLRKFWTKMYYPEPFSRYRLGKTFCFILVFIEVHSWLFYLLSTNTTHFGILLHAYNYPNLSNFSHSLIIHLLQKFSIEEFLNPCWRSSYVFRFLYRCSSFSQVKYSSHVDIHPWSLKISSIFQWNSSMYFYGSLWILLNFINLWFILWLLIYFNVNWC